MTGDFEPRRPQGKFELFEDSLSAIASFKGVNRNNHLLDYIDIEEELEGDNA